MAVCYDTNGNEDTSQFPCSADGSPAQCCEIGQLCASDGLCVNNGTEPGLTKYSIHGCSVQDWTDGQVDTCPHQCIETGGVGVTDCGVGSFCCYGFGGCDCNNSTQTFDLDPIRIVATISGETSTSTPTTTSSTSSTTSSSPTAEADALSSSSSSSSSSNALPIGLGVGLGVGIPLLIAAIVAVFFCLRKRRNTPAPEKDIGMAGYQAPLGYQAPSAQNGSEAGWYPQSVASPPVPMENGAKPVAGGYFGAQQQAQAMPHELPSRQEPQELPVRQEPHELQ
ncbi:hypothetical protein BJX62DRAFT_251054 [Aspergillus germanicus]